MSLSTSPNSANNGNMVKALAFYYLLICLAVVSLPFLSRVLPLLAHPVVWPIALAGLGSVIYCLRSIYHHMCVTRDWDTSWIVWYWLRPFVGLLSGAVAFVFVQAGLVLLNAEGGEKGSPWGLYAISIIAGYNVDQFWALIEKVMKDALGLERSRLGSKDVDK
jgi:hypothetical protein